MQASTRSFRVRLLRAIGPVLVGTLAILCFMVWIAAYIGFVSRNEAILDAEMRDVSFLVGGTSTLQIDRYRWDEPHHVRADRRLDPMFVQVFDSSGALVWLSPNFTLVAPLPQDLLATRGTGSELLPRLATRTVGQDEFYYDNRAIGSATGQTIGHVQVARYVPEEMQGVQRLALYLVALFAVFSSVLLSLVHAATAKVVRPIEEITVFADGIGPGMLSSRVDVSAASDTETKVLGATLNKLLDRLEESLASMRDFTSNAAHELRTPLTVLRGHVELALRRERSGDEYRETLHLLDGQLRRLVRLVNSLLDLARLDRSEPLPREDVDLALLLLDVSDSTGGASSGRVKLDAPDTVIVTAEEELLFRAVSNLVENALLYGGDRPVTIRLIPGETEVVVAVEDQGPGIPSDELDRVWERFFRGDTARRSGEAGNGLGLSLVSAIAARHGGRVEAVNLPGVGLSMRVHLPVQDAESLSL